MENPPQNASFCIFSAPSAWLKVEQKLYRRPYRVTWQRNSCVQRLQTGNLCSCRASFNWWALTGSISLPDGHQFCSSPKADVAGSYSTDWANQRYLTCSLWHCKLSALCSATWSPCHDWHGCQSGEWVLPDLYNASKASPKMASISPCALWCKQKFFYPNSSCFNSQALSFSNLPATLKNI